jgi:Sulfotransferase family
LVGRHSRYAFVPVEARFHAEPGGLPGLIAGQVTPEQFVSRMRSEWWQRIDSSGSEAGLDRIVSRRVFDAALAEFEERVRHDPVAAAAGLVRTLLGSLADADGKPSFVEMTPATGLNATTLARLFPDMRIVHVVRDGREVAGSVSRLWGWELEYALEWWFRRVRRVFLEERALPPGTVLTLRLERLVAKDRERSYAALLDFLRMGDEPEMRRFFDESISPKRMRTPALRKAVPEQLGRRLDRRYGEMLAELDAEIGESASALVDEL